MKKTTIILSLILVSFLGGICSNALWANGLYNLKPVEISVPDIKPGAFSLSISVKDLKKSKEFYEKLGFKLFGGAMEQNYVIMKNGNALIGLFQGMFEGNMLTFNPGWDENAKNMKKYTDIRDIQKHLKANGVTLDLEVDESSKGPGSVMLKDPDGNVILLDQHR